MKHGDFLSCMQLIIIFMQHRGIGKATVQAKIKRNLVENLDVMGNAELIFFNY